MLESPKHVATISRYLVARSEGWIYYSLRATTVTSRLQSWLPGAARGSDHEDVAPAGHQASGHLKLTKPVEWRQICQYRWRLQLHIPPLRRGEVQVCCAHLANGRTRLCLRFERRRVYWKSKNSLRHGADIFSQHLPPVPDGREFLTELRTESGVSWNKMKTG